MSEPEVTEKLVEAINSDAADFYVVNYANCDMVGHTGVVEAAVKACEAVDDGLSRVIPAVLAKGGFALITADHGNADHMYDVVDGKEKPFTAHTTACPSSSSTTSPSSFPASRTVASPTSPPPSSR